MFALLAGCREPTVEDLAPVVDPAPLAPTVLRIGWDGASGPTGWHAEATPTDGGRTVVSDPASDGAVTLYGVKAGRRYDVVAVTDAGDRSPPATIDVAPAPDAIPPTSVVLAEGAVVVDGYVATSVVYLADGHSVLVVVDGDGDVVWWWDPGTAWDVSTVTASADGSAFVFGQFDAAVASDRAEAVELAPDGETRAKFAIPGAHHVALGLGDDAYAWLELTTRAEAVDGVEILAGTDRIVEGGPDGDRRVVYDAFDDLYADGFHYPCLHSRRAADRYGIPDLVQWTHGNSLVYLPDDDAFVLNERWADTVVKVDRASASVVWQLGGPASSFTFPDGASTVTTADAPVLWSHGHLSDAWSDGLWMFDNGDHRDPPTSRAVRYAIDEDARTVTLAQEIPAPDGAFVEVLGDARRLPDGHALVTWSELGLIHDVAPDGSVGWALQLDGDLVVGRARYFDSFGRL
ncbi:MAG: aryl-sulfate sulfotransferase [Myxococcota bacterium]